MRFTVYLAVLLTLGFSIADESSDSSDDLPLYNQDDEVVILDADNFQWVTSYTLCWSTHC